MIMDWSDVLRLANHGNIEPPRRVEKSEDEWRELLDDEQFYVTRLKGTERPFSSEMCSLFEPGLYACSNCGTELFNSATKFDSGTGWPSFSEPVEDNVVAYHRDGTHGMERIEATCNVCDAHLGHVFPDGPHPSGLRFCINALSLGKVEQDG
jgi:peptide-methionine (R)-S-oxide reductase